MKYLLSVYLLVLLNVSFANTSDSLKVIVLDENGSGIPGVKVNIESNPTYTSNNSGVFYFVPNQKLVFPFSLNINKAGYELKEFMYYEDDGEIEIRIAQAKSQEITLKFLSDKAKPLTGLSINYKGKSYSSDKKGLIKIQDKSLDEKSLTIKGFQLVKTESDQKNTTYTIHVTATSSEKPADKKPDAVIPVSKQEVPVNNTSSEQTENELWQRVFQEYSQDLDNLSKEIITEQKRLMENNKKIRDEIARLTDKLKNEKNLSEEQRAELKKQIDSLEKTLVENAAAYEKVETKTISMIQDLKLLVMQKDSLHALTLKKLKAEEEKRKSAEMKNKRTIIIFTIITISLTFLAVSFYAIARKMRQQKKALAKANEELRLLKEQTSPGSQLVNQ